MSRAPDGSIIGLETRVRQLMDDHETLLAVTVVNETDEGYYALVVREWDHPTEGVEARILSERYAYLTKGSGNDGWVTSSKTVAINRRDALDAGALATGLAQTDAAVAARQRNGGDDLEPHLADVTEE